MEDVLTDIFKQVQDIPTYKTILLTSKQYNKAVQTKNIGTICNLMSFINLNPDKDWN